MPFDIIWRVFHSFLASRHKMLQAHLFHLPQTWNQPLPQGAMNLSSGKQYLMLGLFIGTKWSLFLGLVSIYNKLTYKSLWIKSNLQAKETASHLLLYRDYWDSYLLEGNSSLPGKVCIKEKKEILLNSVLKHAYVFTNSGLYTYSYKYKIKVTRKFQTHLNWTWTV